MDLDAWMKQVRDKAFLFALFDMLFLCLSGIAVLFFFQRVFFESTDWVKLVLLSGAITAPFVFFNTLAFSAFEDDEEVKKRDGLFVSLTAASMSTAILLNAPLVLIYWEGWTLKDYTVSVAIMEVIVLAISFFEARRYKKEKLAGRRILKKASERKKKTAAANKI